MPTSSDMLLLVAVLAPHLLLLHAHLALATTTIHGRNFPSLRVYLCFLCLYLQSIYAGASHRRISVTDEWIIIVVVFFFFFSWMCFFRLLMYAEPHKSAHGNGMRRTLQRDLDRGRAGKVRRFIVLRKKETKKRKELFREADMRCEMIDEQKRKQMQKQKQKKKKLI
jgi:hypothetical protein